MAFKLNRRLSGRDRHFTVNNSAFSIKIFASECLTEIMSKVMGNFSGESNDWIPIGSATFLLYTYSYHIGSVRGNI
jgi:hypothetical protein